MCYRRIPPRGRTAPSPSFEEVAYHRIATTSIAREEVPLGPGCPVASCSSFAIASLSPLPLVSSRSMYSEFSPFISVFLPVSRCTLLSPLCVCVFRFNRVTFRANECAPYDRIHCRFRRCARSFSTTRRDKTTCRLIASWPRATMPLRRFGNTLVRHAINSLPPALHADTL